jgi:DNA invertase Pin-like site-specific DNA recombinase
MDAKPSLVLVGYARVSTQRQGQSGLGLEAQQEASARYSAATGRPVLRWYLEIESGRRSDRPELQKALDHARRIRATLVIARLDRLARSARFLLALIEGGADVAFCDFPNLPAGAAGKFLLSMLASVAELEAGLISERTKAALAAAKARGVRLGRDNLTPEGRARGLAESARVRSERAARDHAQILPRILELRAAGLSQQAIANCLNADGHLTRSGKPWHQIGIKRLLDQPR